MLVHILIKLELFCWECQEFSNEFLPQYSQRFNTMDSIVISQEYLLAAKERAGGSTVCLFSAALMPGRNTCLTFHYFWFIDNFSIYFFLGNGNSNLPIELYTDAYQNITSMDYAETSIEKLSLKSPPDIKYECADMRFMKFDRTFDTIIEKSTLDVLFTKESSPWMVSKETESDVNKTLNAIKACLNKNGQFISITFAEPFFRKKYLVNFWNNFTVEKFGNMFHYYFIVCKSWWYENFQFIKWENINGRLPISCYWKGSFFHRFSTFSWCFWICPSRVYIVTGSLMIKKWPVHKLCHATKIELCGTEIQSSTENSHFSDILTELSYWNSQKYTAVARKCVGIPH